MKEKYPILVIAPHASAFVPAPLKKMMQLNEFEIRRESDLYTDQLYKVDNAYYLEGNISRLITDLNRSPEHIEMEYQLAKDGAVISINENGEPIYKEPPCMESILKRIEKYHHPFHKKIEAFKPRVKFILDGHSMLSKGPKTKADRGRKRPEICVGNHFYTACSRVLTNKVAQFFRDKGLETTINQPYEGRYVTGYHCSRTGINGVTLEFNRKLFMNQKTLEPKPKAIKKINEMIYELVEILGEELKNNEL